MKDSAWYNSLRVQIVALFTLALFPLGAVAIYQTNRVATEADRTAELALLAVAGRAAKAEELIIESAFGAARFFATIAEDFHDNPDRCTEDLSDFVQKNDRYSFVGILPLSGEMTCTSTGGAYDFSNWPGFEDAMAAKEATIVVNTQGPASDQSVFVISEPFELDGAFAGFISVSIPHSGLPDTPDAFTELGLEELMTFNTDGKVLTARSDLENGRRELPKDRALGALSGSSTIAFKGRNQADERRTYTIVPIEGSPATVIGVWRASDGLASDAAALVRPSLFPVLMWFASMGVAILSIYRLVLRHLSRLRLQMDAFTEARAIPTENEAITMPNELQALSDNFYRMTQDIVRDEAGLENALHEKNVLIKEVHHRVKNNLQLISSIMNMQIRSAEEPETKTALLRVQDRVRSLATIHRDLYQSQHGGRVDAGALISEIIERSIDVGVGADKAVRVETEIDPVLLYPDQSVPLSLLAAEGATNIMKYIGTPEMETAWITASLKTEGQTCTLILANSKGDGETEDGTGLGAELMEAFAIQLNAQIETDETADSYTMRVQFDIEDFVPEAQDY